LTLRPLEAAAGFPIGTDETSTFTITPTDSDPLEALIDVVTGVLTRGPTYVAFSGGRDSSAVLATTTLAARRLGLPDPVPITQRFIDIPSTEEDSWQQAVVDRLGLGRWEVIEIGAELDLLGEVARDALLTHGVMWPPNSYFLVPMLQRARGGTLMTGFDGDGIFGSWRWQRAQAVLHRRVRPVPRDAARVGLALAPPWARRVLMPELSLARATPWLRPAAQAELDHRLRRDAAAEPRRWPSRLALQRRARIESFAIHAYDVLAASRQMAIANPILDGRFVSALACAGGPAGFGDRNAVMRAVFGSVLPETVLSRRSKAEFGRAIWRTQARAFIEQWDGTGIDADRVDADRLRQAWRAPSPLYGSISLLHGAWLAQQA
jgi:hypothetical protein